MRYEDLFDGSGTMPVPGRGNLPLSPTSPSATAPAAGTPANAPVGPGLQGPYFQPGTGDPGAALARLERGRPGVPVPEFDDRFFGQLRNTLSGVISGRDVPYSAGLVRQIKGGAYANAKDAAAVGVRSANSDALRRGVFRSAAGVNDAAAARDRAAAQATNATADIDVQAAKANYDARMEGIRQGKALLDQLAERIRNAQLMGMDTAKAEADLMLAYDRIASAERMQHNDLNAALERQLIGGAMGA